MAVIFRRTNAKIDRLAGVGTLLVALLALVDGFIIGALFLALGGASIYWLTSAKNTPLVAFVARVIFAAFLFLAGVFIIGA